MVDADCVYVHSGNVSLSGAGGLAEPVRQLQQNRRIGVRVRAPLRPESVSPGTLTQVFGVLARLTTKKPRSDLSFFTTSDCLAHLGVQKETKPKDCGHVGLALVELARKDICELCQLGRKPVSGRRTPVTDEGGG